MNKSDTGEILTNLEDSRSWSDVVKHDTVERTVHTIVDIVHELPPFISEGHPLAGDVYGYCVSRAGKVATCTDKCDRLWENRPIGADIGIEQ